MRWPRFTGASVVDERPGQLRGPECTRIGDVPRESSMPLQDSGVGIPSGCISVWAMLDESWSGVRTRHAPTLRECAHLTSRLDTNHAAIDRLMTESVPRMEDPSVDDQDQADHRRTGPEREVERPPSQPQEPAQPDRDERAETEFRFPGGGPGAQGVPMTSDAPAQGGAATGAESKEGDPE